VRELVSLLPDASYVMIENAGHGVLVEAGPEVAHAIGRFVNTRVAPLRREKENGGSRASPARSGRE
jgi:hypothetical protein